MGEVADNRDNQVPGARPPGDGDGTGLRMDSRTDDEHVLADPEYASPPQPSRKARLVPPDGKPLPWWVQHRKKLILLEWGISALFIALSIYYMWLMFFAPEPVVSRLPLPTREEFRERLRALPVPPVNPAWEVAAKAGRWRCIVLHHTDTAGGSPEAIDRFHREVKKWQNGLGYHFLIGNGKGMKDGEVVMSRRWLEQLDGAHVRMKENAKVNDFGMAKDANGNSFSIGVALVGDFEETMPTPAQLASLRSLLVCLRKTYGIGLAAITGHGDVAAQMTLCPGKCFYVQEVVLALANP